MEEILKEILVEIGIMKNELVELKAQIQDDRSNAASFEQYATHKLEQLETRIQDSQNSAVLFENRTMEEFGAIKHQMQIVIDYGKSMLKLHTTTTSTLDDNIEEQTVLAVRINELEKRTSALEQMLG